MKESNKPKLVLETSGRYVAYDAHSGRVVHVHEFLSETGSSANLDKSRDMETVQRAAARDVKNKSIKVCEVPQGFEIKTGVSYCVDKTGKLKESSASPTAFREFLKQEDAE